MAERLAGASVDAVELELDGYFHGRDAFLSRDARDNASVGPSRVDARIGRPEGRPQALPARRESRASGITDRVECRLSGMADDRGRGGSDPVGGSARSVPGRAGGRAWDENYDLNGPYQFSFRVPVRLRCAGDAGADPSMRDIPALNRDSGNLPRDAGIDAGS